MQNATNISAHVASYFNGLNKRVTQKGNIGGYYSYALQLMREHTYVYRARNGKRVDFDVSKNRPILDLHGSAYGHTQTWEYAGKENSWFVGVKPLKDSGWRWATQIARITFPKKFHSLSYSSNTQLPRLSWLRCAGNMTLDGPDFNRSEAAVTPDYQYMLIVTLSKSNRGYFSLYKLKDINDALDKNGSRKDTKLTDIKAYAGFNIDLSSINSFQGFDIDNDHNIYISSQKHPDGQKTHPRKIVKIPWNSQSESDWQVVNLDPINLDWHNRQTELEGIQVLGNNHVYLTVSYHGDDGTQAPSRVYEVTWD